MPDKTGWLARPPWERKNKTVAPVRFITLYLIFQLGMPTHFPPAPMGLCSFVFISRGGLINDYDFESLVETNHVEKVSFNNETRLMKRVMPLHAHDDEMRRRWCEPTYCSDLVSGESIVKALSEQILRWHTFVHFSIWFALIGALPVGGVLCFREVEVYDVYCAYNLIISKQLPSRFCLVFPVSDASSLLFN